MPSEELGASAYRKVDMEAWMPGKNAWGEVRTLVRRLTFAPPVANPELPYPCRPLGVEHVQLH